MKPAPIVGKKGAEPLMARASTDATMTIRTASKAVFSASERLLLNRTMIKVAAKTITPRSEICRKVSSFVSLPKPRNIVMKSENTFISEILSPGKHLASLSIRKNKSVHLTKRVLFMGKDENNLWHEEA